jgi:SAM-dependent methyltransferase
MNMKETIRGQFQRPQGTLGVIAGLIMAKRRSNIERNLATVELLAAEPGDRVLEIGHGPGIALAELADRVDNGQIIGVDHSSVMHAQAARLNRAAVADGRVKLIVGDLSAIEDVAPIDRAMLVNVAMFWDDPVNEFARIRSLLGPGGRLAVTHQPRNAQASSSDTDRATDQLMSQLQEAGFVDILADTLELPGVPGICLRAHAPMSASGSTGRETDEHGGTDRLKSLSE